MLDIEKFEAIDKNIVAWAEENPEDIIKNKGDYLMLDNVHILDNHKLGVRKDSGVLEFTTFPDLDKYNAEKKKANTSNYFKLIDRVNFYKELDIRTIIHNCTNVEDFVDNIIKVKESGNIVIEGDIVKQMVDNDYDISRVLNNPIIYVRCPVADYITYKTLSGFGGMSFIDLNRYRYYTIDSINHILYTHKFAGVSILQDEPLLKFIYEPNYKFEIDIDKQIKTYESTLNIINNLQRYEDFAKSKDPRLSAIEASLLDINPVNAPLWQIKVVLTDFIECTDVYNSYGDDIKNNPFIKKEIALAYFNNQELETAIKLIESMELRDKALEMLLSQCYYFSGKIKKAKDILRKYILRDNDEIMFNFYYGMR